MRGVIALIIFCSFFKISSAQTNVSGSVSGTWTKAKSPYFLQDDVTIPNGQTLKIEAGVEVEAKGWYGIFVDGRILCEGKNGDMIKMHSNFKDGWKGIRFIETDPSNDTSYINFVEILDGRQYRDDSEKFNGIGGGLLIVGTSKVQINNCSFHDNKAQVGGAIYVWGLNDNEVYVSINACKIYNNEAFETLGLSASGGISLINCVGYLTSSSIHNNSSNGIIGGVGVYGGDFKIDRCQIVQNQNSGDGDAQGGGIVCWGNGEIQIINSDISNNFTTGQGAGVWIEQGSKFFASNCKIDSNTINPGHGQQMGVAVYSLKSDEIVFESCEFSQNGYNNKNTVGNSVFYFNNADVTFRGCTISNNFGPAFYLNNGASMFAQNTIFANHEYGSSLIKSDAVWLNCNFVNNRGRSALFTGGLFMQSTSPKFYNCVFYGNRDTLGNNANIYLYNTSADPTFKNCIIEGGKDKFYGDGAGSNYSGTYENNLDIDPQFVNPTKGPGVNFDATKADWRLKNDCSQISPALNKGTSSLPTGLSLPEVDLNGNPRIATDTVDIGAYEIQVPKDRAQIQIEYTDTTQFCVRHDTTLRMEANASNPSFLWHTSKDGEEWTYYGSGKRVSFIEVGEHLNNIWVRGSILADCNLTDTFYTVLSIQQPPIPDISDTFFNCSGMGVEVFNENHSEGNSYTWNDGTTGYPGAFNPDTSDYYRVEVAGKNNCSSTDTFFISNVPLPVVNLGADVNIGSNDQITLKPQENHHTYLWNSGDTTATLKVSGRDLGKGTHEFWVEVTDQNGCVGRDSIFVSVGLKNIHFNGGIEQGIFIYPNPISFENLSDLTIEVDGEAICYIFNFNGRKVYSGPLHKINGTLENGIYILKIVTTNQTYSTRLIKQ